MHIKTNLVPVILHYMLLVHFCGATNTTTPIKVGLVLMTNSSFPVDLPRIGPAVDMGKEEVKRRYDINLQIEVGNYSVWCERARYYSLGSIANMYYTKEVRAFIGPACSYAVQSSGRLTEYLRVPMITGLGDLLYREEKDMFETTVIMSYNTRKLSVSVRALLKEYGWRHVAVIYDEQEVFYKNAGPSMIEDFKHDPDFPDPYELKFNRTDNWLPEETMEDASAHARVFVVLVNAPEFRTLMYRAVLLDMADGDYVFIAIQLAEIDWWGTYRKYHLGDALDPILDKVYESVMILTLVNTVAENIEFQQELKKRAQTNYGYTFSQNDTVHYFITAFYEAVLYLGAAYNKSLVETGSIEDGYAIARMFFNSSFEGLNQSVALDEHGTRIADFHLLDLLHARNQTWQTVGAYYGAKRAFELFPGTAVRFPQGVPADQPVCGFRGELCIKESLSLQAIVGIISGCLIFVLIAIIITQMMYSRRKANMDNRWRVAWKDIDVLKAKGSLVSGFSKSRISMEQEVSGSHEDLTPVYGTMGHYMGTNVFIRRFNFTQIDLTSKVMAEMRKMYHLRHNNIETFIGACVDTGNIAVMSEICPRGSLMDIIANDSIELDWSFRHSLINDVVQGMKYLHNSEIGAHGQLRSSNCVVDSRFMLKIKGFGPKCFHELEHKNMNASLANPSKFLWTAPELLRHAGWTSGTREGDVYSFAIILQEIVVRGAPYESSDLSVVEILDRVRHPTVPPFRPTFLVTPDCAPGLVDLMEACWAEERTKRPTFDSVDASLKRILKSKGSNIMDNLMRRMEQYANNLESLVEERTNAYVEEKKRAEDLLYRMLPVSVARQLQTGNQVEPETFDMATIYFSDIVGFTTIASRSNPMEVVNLLNDLYTTFDAIINNFHVYKVETIGDAYMVASGLPIRIGNKHVTEISNMALAIRKSVEVFKIRHFPNEPMRIRIGLHSGGVVAGVVGLTMPRYCLFGDTVNTASRMESNGEAMKIHISEPTMKLLDKTGNYEIELRGGTDIKGKGTMKTYWLVGLKNPVVAEICPSNNAALNDNKPRPSSGNRRKSIPGNHKSKIKLHNQNSADIENASIPGCVQNHVIETKIDNSPDSVECNPQDSSHDPFKVVLETHRFARICSHKLGEPKTNELVVDHVRAMTDGRSTTPVTDA